MTLTWYLALLILVSVRALWNITNLNFHAQLSLFFFCPFNNFVFFTCFPFTVVADQIVSRSLWNNNKSHTLRNITCCSLVRGNTVSTAGISHKKTIQVNLQLLGRVFSNNNIINKENLSLFLGIFNYRMRKCQPFQMDLSPTVH